MDGVAHGLALGGGAGIGLGEAQHAAAQGQHGGLKAQPGPGGGLEEQGGQLLVGTGVLVFDGVCDDVLGGGDQLIDLLHGQIGDVNDISGHEDTPFGTAVYGTEQEQSGLCENDWGPRANLAERFAWGEETQGSGWRFRRQAEPEQSGLCGDERSGSGGERRNNRNGWSFQRKLETE